MMFCTRGLTIVVAVAAIQMLIMTAAAVMMIWLLPIKPEDNASFDSVKSIVVVVDILFGQAIIVDGIVVVL